tara:strand:- start:2112 stop:2360 length:249 start_codon:yes stop_codon:yes gene_type:complete
MYIKLREKLINDLKHLEKMFKEYHVPVNLPWDEIKKEKREIILQNLVTRLNTQLNTFLNHKPSYNDWMTEIAEDIKKTNENE